MAQTEAIFGADRRTARAGIAELSRARWASTCPKGARDGPWATRPTDMGSWPSGQVRAFAADGVALEGGRGCPHRLDKSPLQSRSATAFAARHPRAARVSR